MKSYKELVTEVFETDKIKKVHEFPYMKKTVTLKYTVPTLISVAEKDFKDYVRRTLKKTNVQVNVSESISIDEEATPKAIKSTELWMWIRKNTIIMDTSYNSSQKVVDANALLKFMKSQKIYAPSLLPWMYKNTFVEELSYNHNISLIDADKLLKVIKPSK